MTNLRIDPISRDDIVEYLSNESDFSFELSALMYLSDAGYLCAHSGTFHDPVTHKLRQFDIRAKKMVESNDAQTLVLRLAVECKNIRENYPVLVQCMPRHSDESYLDVLWRDTLIGSSMSSRHGMRLWGEQSPYRIGEHVGKSLCQVGRKTDLSFIDSDAAVYEKFSQALHSSYDLLQQSFWADDAWGRNKTVSIVVPVLVVPDGRLWKVDYDGLGQLSGEPQQTDHISFYVGQDWAVGNENEALFSTRYCCSHLELISISHLVMCMETFLARGDITLESIVAATK